MAIGAQRIVDAHFHLWDLGENYYPWLSDGSRPTTIKNFERLRRDYLVSDLLRDADGLNLIAGVHIQGEHDHSDVVRETRWLQKVADAPGSRGFPQAIVADADFTQPNIERILDEHCRFSNMRGIRHVVHRKLDWQPPFDPLQNETWRRNFALLRSFNLSFDLQLFARQADDAISLLRDNPDIPINIAHAGMPLWSDEDGAALWRASIKRYALLPQTMIKISGFGSHAPGWTAKSVEPMITTIMEAFGPSRCMLASNFPVDGLTISYRQIWENFAECFASYSQDERDAIFWRNAARFYRIALKE